MTTLNFEHVLALANQAVEHYCALPSTDQTFGRWVLSTFYPNVSADTLVNGRDFCGPSAPRTRSAISWACFARAA